MENWKLSHSRHFGLNKLLLVDCIWHMKCMNAQHIQKWGDCVWLVVVEGAYVQSMTILTCTIAMCKLNTRIVCCLVSTRNHQTGQAMCCAFMFTSWAIEAIVCLPGKDRKFGASSEREDDNQFDFVFGDGVWKACARLRQIDGAAEQHNMHPTYFALYVEHQIIADICSGCFGW